jgi:hypothetical protein
MGTKFLRAKFPLEPFVDDRFQASIPIRVGRIVAK